jgi:hypothetical protein
MMNRVSILILFSLLSATAASAFDFPVPKNAKTAVYVYSSYSWDNAKGWVVLEAVKTITETFDSTARILTREISHANGVLIEKTKFSYSAGGYRTATYNAKNEMTRQSDAVVTGGRTVETIRRTDGSIFATYRTENASGGLPAREAYYDPVDALVWSIVYTYEGARCTEIAYSNPDGSPAFRSSFEYKEADAEGNWAVCTQYVSYADVRSRPKDIVRRTIEYWR